MSRAFLLAALFAFASPAAAQVNVEGLLGDSDDEGFGGGLEASLSVARGNIETLDVGGAGRAQYRTHHLREAGVAPETPPFIAQRVYVTVSGRFAENAGDPFVSQVFAHARWTAMWHRRVGHELFAQYQYNEFLRLLRRSLFGAGIRVDAVHEAELRVWGGTGYMIESERIDVAEGSSDRPDALNHRWTSYAAIRATFFEQRLRIQNTLYVQPRFDDLRDYRILDELELAAKVTDTLALGVNLALLHDSRPPSGIKTTDLRAVNTLQLTF